MFNHHETTLFFNPLLKSIASHVNNPIRWGEGQDPRWPIHQLETQNTQEDGHSVGRRWGLSLSHRGPPLKAARCPCYFSQDPRSQHEVCFLTSAYCTLSTWWSNPPKATPLPLPSQSVPTPRASSCLSSCLLDLAPTTDTPVGTSSTWRHQGL